MTIAENVTAAKEADELLSLIVDEKPRRFWERLRDIALAKAPLPEQPHKPSEPMTKEEARRFELEELRFGKYKGDNIGYVYEVDPDYLHWLVTAPEWLHKNLTRYLLLMEKEPAQSVRRNVCRSCGCEIHASETYCGECMCEDDSDL